MESTLIFMLPIQAKAYSVIFLFERMFNLSALKNAISSLEAGFARSSASPEDELVRDGAIQRFEYTYDLCWKMLKSTLKIQAPSEDIIDNMSFNELICEGFEHGMSKDPEPWFGYRKKRNIIL